MPPEQHIESSVQLPQQALAPQPAPFVMPQTPVPQIAFAGFWLRFLAVFFDGVIMGIVNFSIVFVLALGLGQAISGATIHPIISAVLGMLLYWTYFIYFTNKQQATIGKKLLGLRVVAEDGSRLPLGKIIFRETFGKILCLITLYIGYLMVAFTAKKQGLHDKVAGSVVISNPSERKTWAFVLSIIFASLLPIIFIIASLSSFVGAVLNVAIMKGYDATVKVSMSSAYTQSKITYGMNNNSYATVCTDPQIVSFFTVAETKAKTKVVCNATATEYAAYLPLKKSTAPNTGFCVDSTGAARESVDIGKATTCYEVLEGKGYEVR